VAGADDPSCRVAGRGAAGPRGGRRGRGEAGPSRRPHHLLPHPPTVRRRPPPIDRHTTPTTRARRSGSAIRVAATCARVGLVPRAAADPASLGERTGLPVVRRAGGRVSFADGPRPGWSVSGETRLALLLTEMRAAPIASCSPRSSGPVRGSTTSACTAIPGCGSTGRPTNLLPGAEREIESDTVACPRRAAGAGGSVILRLEGAPGLPQALARRTRSITGSGDARGRCDVSPVPFPPPRPGVGPAAASCGTNRSTRRSLRAAG